MLCKCHSYAKITFMVLDILVSIQKLQCLALHPMNLDPFAQLEKRKKGLEDRFVYLMFLMRNWFS